MSSLVDIISISTGAVGTIFTIYWALRQSKDKKEKFRKEFLITRNTIKAHRMGLQSSAVSELMRMKKTHLEISDEFPLLTNERWNPDEPIDLEKVKTVFAEEKEPALLRKPLRFNEFDTYSDAITALDKPRMFYDLTHYRLMGIERERLTYSNKAYSYFDKLNAGGALLYQFAYSQKNSRAKPDYWRIAENLSEPSDFIVLSGVNTLVLLICDDGIRFIMSQRKSDLGSSEGTYHVIPAGEFQPSCRAAISFSEDLSIWKTIMRESAEELLCKEEYNGNLGTPFDYNQEPYLSLENARKENTLKVFYLGTGLDPLSFQGEILTCAVYKEKTFTSIFGHTPRTENNESIIINDSARWGRPFTETEIASYLNQNTLAAAKALLIKAKLNLDKLVS